MAKTSTHGKAPAAKTGKPAAKQPAIANPTFS